MTPYTAGELEAIGRAVTAAYRVANERNGHGEVACRTEDAVAEAVVMVRGRNQHPSMYKVESVAVLWTKAEYLANAIRIAHLPDAHGVPAEDRPEWVTR